MHWNWELFLTGVGAFIAFGGLVFGVAKWIVSRIDETRDQNKQLLQEQAQFHSDWSGVDARPGVPRRPGVMERLERLDNNTSGLPDRVAGLESRLGKVEDKVVLLEEVILRRPGN